MKRVLVLMSIFIFTNSAFSADKYFNGKIERIEICKSNGGTIFIYFKDIDGTSPVATNGCSNDIALPYVRLNNDIGTLTDLEKTILSTALTAQAAERTLRVRYDDQSWFLRSLAID